MHPVLRIDVFHYLHALQFVSFYFQKGSTYQKYQEHHNLCVLKVASVTLFGKLKSKKPLKAEGSPAEILKCWFWRILKTTAPPHPSHCGPCGGVGLLVPAQAEQISLRRPGQPWLFGLVGAGLHPSLLADMDDTGSSPWGEVEDTQQSFVSCVFWGVTCRPFLLGSQKTAFGD